MNRKSSLLCLRQRLSRLLMRLLQRKQVLKLQLLHLHLTSQWPLRWLTPHRRTQKPSSRLFLCRRPCLPLILLQHLPSTLIPKCSLM